jgi:hypothetical protein
VTDQHIKDAEAVRQRYRPKRITTLFVGESRPESGKFFYCGNTQLKRHMQEAMEAKGLGKNGDFLECFKAYGWYLDDLVLEPVDKLSKAEREKLCRDARSDLAARIKEYQPSAIVSLLRRIQVDVETAADEAEYNALRFAVPFPGNGQQNRFRNEMARILPQLPRERQFE